MLELLEKAVMTAIGATALTQKKAEELMVEIKNKYKISEENSKILVDKIQAIASESREKMLEMAELEVHRLVERMRLVTREEYDQLVKRVNDLESHRHD